ncbi:MAG: type II secretion system protein GspE, partial [Acidobacteriota bacterium]
MSIRLGDLLIKKGILSPQQLEESLRFQREHGGRLGSILLRLGHVSDEQIAAVLSEQYSLPSVNLKSF